MSTMARRISVLAAITALTAVGCGDDDGDDGTPVDMSVTEDMGECVPTTCAAEGANCGMIADGCGAMIDCGGCTDPETCGGGGTPNVCGEGMCEPTTTCEEEGAECGMIDDGCSVISCPDTCDPDTEMCSDDNTCVAMACVPTSDEEVTWEDCTDGEDNDCNELIDRADEAGCAICPPPGDAAFATAEDSDALCGDGIDNDCDGFPDCVDFDCRDSAITVCPEENTDALCSDGIDNDGDGRIDCLGRSCSETETVTVCQPATPTATEDDATLCGDGLDNDDNGRVDCDDDGCEGIGYCGGPGEDESEVTDGCTDGNDNDGDGRIDCADIDCSENAACTGEDSAAACTDGMDNDNDGLVDCADRDCYTDPSFTVCFATQEDCSMEGDEDFDGLEDCFDPECQSVCEGEPCGPDNPIGTCPDAGQVCRLGACVTPPSAAGQLVITEIMQNPSATSDNDGEYFELYNPSDSVTYNLIGCEITSGTNGPYEIDASVEVAPGAYVALARSAAPGFTPAYVYDSGFSLGNSSDDAQISCGGTLIDIVTWDNGATFPDPNGASMNLSPTALDATSNNDGANWCEATMDLGNGDLGTPGAANDACP